MLCYVGVVVDIQIERKMRAWSVDTTWWLMSDQLSWDVQIVLFRCRGSLNSGAGVGTGELSIRQGSHLRVADSTPCSPWHGACVPRSERGLSGRLLVLFALRSFVYRSICVVPLFVFHVFCFMRKSVYWRIVEKLLVFDVSLWHLMFEKKNCQRGSRTLNTNNIL